MSALWGAFVAFAQSHVDAFLLSVTALMAMIGYGVAKRENGRLKAITKRMEEETFVRDNADLGEAGLSSDPSFFKRVWEATVRKRVVQGRQPPDRK